MTHVQGGPNDFDNVFIRSYSSPVSVASVGSETAATGGTVVAPADCGGAAVYTGGGTGYVDTGLTSGPYAYRVCSYDDGGPAVNYSAGATVVTAVIIDTVPTADVTGFAVANPATGNLLNLSWTNPTDADFSGVKIVRANGATAPLNCTGTAIYTGAATSYADTSVTDGQEYSYRICTYDIWALYSGGVTGSGTPTDTVAPAGVTGFTVTLAGNNGIYLSWTNPVGSEFAGTKILRKAGSAVSLHGLRGNGSI